jgi:hypothetical protein
MEKLRLLSCWFLVLSLPGLAQIPGRNVNMVSGTKWPDGDPFLQRQNEPSMAVSTRNPLHILAGSNDYRTVDLPGLPDGETGDAWLGIFKSYDGGQTWKSTIHPGCQQNVPQCDGAPFLKNYSATADPVVRAGSNGMLYYSGIAFTRTSPMKSVVFVSRFIDNNNQQNGDPIKYIDTLQVDPGRDGKFVDKPWTAVDIPRPGAAMCDISTPQPNGPPLDQKFPAGNIYLAYTTFSDETRPPSQIMFARSINCGATWSRPIALGDNALHQGATLAIDPNSGAVYVAWRRFKSPGVTDAILLVKSIDGGLTFTDPQVVATIQPFDQGTTSFSFRTNAYPTMTVDGAGRVYLAWSERGFGTSGDARIVITTSRDGGAHWTDRTPVNDFPARGHQFMPAMTFAGGKLMVIFYDLRQDNTVGIFTATGQGRYVEKRQPAGDLATSPPRPEKVFTNFVLDAAPSNLNAGGLLRRHTLDVWAAQSDPGDTPFFSTARVSSYIFGSRPNSKVIEQLQVNPPNLPLFKQGTAPFFGDYLDIAASPSMVPGEHPGTWKFNTEPSSSVAFHAVWTDNRDVRPPANGDWTDYTPPTSPSTAGLSLFDPSKVQPACRVGQSGMRNQNIYTARINQGLLVTAPANTKTLGAIQRAFPVTIANSTNTPRIYRLTIASQPPGGKASFLQFPQAGLPDPLVVLDVVVPAISSISRMVFVRSTDILATVRVNVAEIEIAGAPDILKAGLQGTVLLNPDPSNPGDPALSQAELFNPDIANPDIANPDIANPDIANPDIANPDIANPDIANPDIANPDIANPDIANPDIANPDIANPDIANPDIANPDIANPDIANAAISDATWKLTNQGNATASYAVQIVLNQGVTIPSRVKVQLLLHKTYSTPVVVGCTLTQQSQPIILANIPGPVLASQPGSSQDATVTVGPGETVKITLRFINTDKTQPFGFDPLTGITVVVVSQAANTGDSQPPSDSSHLVIETTSLPAGVAGSSYSMSVVATGGTPPYQFAIASGSLPPGLALDASTGVISGTVASSAGGSYPFTVQATDSAPVAAALSTRPLAAQATVTQPLSIQISRVALSVTSLVAAGPAGTAVARTGDTITVTVGVLNSGDAADNVAPTLTMNTSGSATASCGTPSPSSAGIGAAGVQNFAFACGSVSGFGTLTFTIQLLGTDHTGGESITVGPATSNAVNVLGPPPVITTTAVAGSQPYTSGMWTNQNVTVTFMCVTSTGDPTFHTVTVTAAGANQSVSSTCTDLTGGSTTATFSGINIDRTPPLVDASATSGDQPYSGGYTNQGVAVTFNCSDPGGSGVVSGASTVLVFSQGLGQTVTGTCMDAAGNTATGTFGPINIILAKPQLTAVYTTSTGSYSPGSFSASPVTVTFVCAPALGIGYAQLTSPVTVTTEGRDRFYPGSCTDLAGNASQINAGPVNISLTAPALLFLGRLPANANGWYRADVTLSWTCNDHITGTSTIDRTISTEGANQAVTVTCSNPAGVTVSDTQSVNLDKTPPVIAGQSSPSAPGASGWFITPVAVSFNCTDTISGLAGAPTGGTTLSSDTAGTTVNGSCTDLAGNTATLVLGPFKLDLTPPQIQLQSITPANAAGWNKAAVTATWSCADATSGPVSSTVTQTLSSNGAGQSAIGTCQDIAGNTASNTRNGINIDTTPPTISIQTSPPAPNAAGWFITPVTVSFTCTDALSGALPPTGGTTLSADTTGATVNGSCTDVAGNTATASSPSIKIDRTPPQTQFQSITPANAAGWNKTPVTVTWSCTDATSGPVSSTVSQTVSGDGAGQSAAGTCLDAAGNSASATRSGINIDTAPPTIAVQVSPPSPGESGWYGSPVTVSFICTDGLSSALPPVGGTTLTADTPGTTVNGSCTDVAGNAATASSATIKIDRTAPVIQFMFAGPLNAQGWANGPVTLTWSCSDATSGVVASTVAQVISSAGANQSATGTCQDGAGHTASDTQGGINIDLTLPTVALTSPADGATYFTNSAIPVSYSCSDNVAVLSCQGSGQNGLSFFSPPGDHTFTVIATDIAGNKTVVTHTYHVQ